MMVDNNSQHSAILSQLNLLVKQFKVKLLWHSLVTLFPWLLLLLVIGFDVNLPISFVVLTALMACLCTVLIRAKSARYQQVTLAKLLLHLNRKYPQLQESAQLLNCDEESLSILQTLQKERTIVQLKHLLIDDKQLLLPEISHRASVVSFVVALFVLLVINLSSRWLPLLNQVVKEPNKVVVQQVDSLASNSELMLRQSNITVSPPTYTLLKVRQQSALDVNVIAGSIIHWQLSFNQPVDEANIEFSNGEKLSLTKQNEFSYILDRQVNSTSIYRLGASINGVEKILPDIFTLTVIKDMAPKIKIITPKQTITELSTLSEAQISTHVLVTDDFEVNKVEILASIAKGSGESVKFRDQVFLFDSEQTIDGVKHYFKHWQLKDLNMEPGDELYFTVKAWDNRQPNTQMTRSNTKIIRWLEDEEQAVLSDGILIDFMPEYFKSQRQIIIETIELIDDKTALTTAKFNEKSELLGVAQSELKEKYGQYLGDEVEDGGGSHAISEEASEQLAMQAESETSHISSQESEHHHEESGGHVSDSFNMKTFGTDKSGGSEVINQFGHNHEDADIGIMARQDPKALMKRSIANMWQAELHLMLSEPSKALPFEQEALKYLKMAKKAERIYVKRLGFEPPPVTEQRRYQGELADILSYQQDQKIDLSDSEQMQLRRFFTWLNTVFNMPSKTQINVLSLTQRQLVVNVKKQFENLVETRPVLIKYVAILERILLSNNLELDGCQSCLADLLEKVWQLLPEPIAKPVSPRKPYADSDIVIRKYADILSERS